MFQTRLKELREAAGYKSQQAFADVFGVAQSTVGGWESGKREPNYAMTIRLANFFGVSVDSLINDGKGDLAMEEYPTALPAAMAFLACLELGMSKEDAYMRTLPAEEVPYTVSAHLWRTRVATNLSQEAMSKKLSIPLTDYKKMETGEIQPSDSQLETIAKKLNVDPDWLCCNTHYVYSTADSTAGLPFDPVYKVLVDSGLDPVENKDVYWPFIEQSPLYPSLLQCYNLLNQEGQEKLVDFADDMVKSGKYIKSSSDKLGETQGA